MSKYLTKRQFQCLMLTFGVLSVFTLVMDPTSSHIYFAFASIVAAAVISGGMASASAATVAGATAYSIAMAGVVQGTTTLALGYASKYMQERRQDDSSGVSEQSRGTTSRQSVAHRRVIYGTSKVGGTPVFYGTSGNANQYLHMVIAFADHEIDAFETFYVDDDKLSLDSNGFDTGNKYGDKIRIKEHLGSDSQTADSDLVSEVSEWTTSHRGRGVAYAYVRLEHDRNIFTGGIPNISVVIRGKKVFDPRSNSTTFSNNAALCIRDYLSNDRYGLGVNDKRLSDSQISSAADTCDEQVNLDGGGTVDRYTIDGTVKLDRSHKDVIRGMNSAMAGETVYSGGQWYIRPGEYTSPVMDFVAEPDTDGQTSDVIETMNIQTKASRRENYNGIKGTYYSPENDWQMSDFPPLQDSAALTEDQNEERWKDIDLAFTTNPATAQRISKIQLSKSRQQLTIDVRMRLRALEVIAGENVTLTHKRLGWDKKEFVVKDWSFVANEDDNGQPAVGIGLRLQETASSVFDWDPSADEQKVTTAPDTTVPDAFDVSEPSNLQLDSGDDTLIFEEDGTVVPRIKSTWTQPSDSWVVNGGTIEIQFKKSSESVWEKDGFVDGSETQHFISPVESGVDYDVRIRSVSILGVTSDWVTVNNHSVIGKTALPSDVPALGAVQNGSRVTLDWTRVSDKDVEGYIIKYGKRGDSSWESARLLSKEESGSSLTSEAVPPGDYTFYIKAVNRSGNQSENAATADLEVTTDFDVVHQREYAPAWPDESLDGDGNTGILDADSWGLEPWGDFTWGASGPTFVRAWNGNLRVADQKKAKDYGYELFDNYINNPVDSSGYQGETHDVGKEVTARLYADIDGDFGPGNSGSFDPILQVRAWSEGEDPPSFENWTSGTKVGRYFQFRIITRNTDGEIYYISGFEETADAEEREESGKESVDTSGNVTITFDTEFVNEPGILVTAEDTNAKIATYSDVTVTDFTANIFDDTGTQVEGTVSWTATGV